MMRSKLMKKLGNKEDLDPMEKEAKMGVMKELSRQAGSILGDKIQPVKKVEVASNSKEGLKAGLNKAEDIVEGAEEELGSDLDHDNEEGESAEHSAKVLGGDVVKDMEDCSPEEIDEKIAQLEALKAKKQGDHAPGY